MKRGRELAAEAATLFVSYLTIYQMILYLFPVLLKRSTDAEINRQSTPSSNVFMELLRGGYNSVTHQVFFGVAVVFNVYHI